MNPKSEDQILFDYSKLAGRIVEKLKNRTKFYELMNWSHTTGSSKMSSRSQFTQGEIIRALRILEIPETDLNIRNYFFTIVV